MPIVITGVTYELCTPAADGKVRIVHDGLIEREDVFVKEYTNLRNEKVAIAMSREVQDIIGLPMHEMHELTCNLQQMDNLFRQLKEASDAGIVTLLTVIHEIVFSITKASFMKRLVYLFTGKGLFSSADVNKWIAGIKKEGCK